MRPVSAQFPINQAFASMRTAGVVGNINASPATVEYWVGRYGNYQPAGHAGCDFACPEGTPVYAMADGTVLWSDWGTKLPGDDSWGPNGYFRRWALYKGFPGIVTVIQHPGWIGVYAHLSDAPLNPGDKVAEGQRIATSGSTGGVDPHLHVEALIDLNYPTGNGLIYGRTNPEPFFGGAGIAAMGGTITETKEWYDMPVPKEDLDSIANAVLVALNTKTQPVTDINGDNPNMSVVEALQTVAFNTSPIIRDGRRISLRQETADAKTMLLSLQGQIAGLTNAVQQLAAKNGAPVDLAAVTAAAEAGATRALGDFKAVTTTTLTK